MEFPIFFTEINKYKITLDFQDMNPDKFTKTYDLIYEIFEFELLKNQDKNYIKRLRKNGTKIKLIKKRITENDKYVYKSMYYRLYAYHKKSNSYINKRVDMILNKKINIGYRTTTNAEYVSQQITKIIPVTKKSPRVEKYTLVFDILASYLDKRSSIQQKEHKERKQDIPLDKLQSFYYKKRTQKKEKRKIDKEKHKKWLERNKKQVNRWKSSSTYRHNKELSSPKLKPYWDSLGLIDPFEKCITDWRVVDVDNNFNFNGLQFQISNKCKQYKVENKINEKNMKFYENKAEMDMILVYFMLEKNEYHYFDQDIKRIDNKLIIQVEKPVYK